MYSFDGRIRYSECDEEGVLTLTAMMNYLQDCSTFHSESLGIGLDYLREHHMGWILASWQIEVCRLPRFNEAVTTSTWCYGMSRLHAQRNFRMSDASAADLVRADSQWLLFDLAAGRPIHIPDDQLPYLTGEPRLDMPALPRRIQGEGEPVACAPVTVGEQHLDTNRHVNNAQYVLMAQQALREAGAAIDVRRLTVQYRRMAWLGDVICPRVYVMGDSRVVELADESGTAFSRVRMDGGVA